MSFYRIPSSIPAQHFEFQMSGFKWEETRRAIVDISNEAMQYDTDGISLRFLNSTLKEDGIKVSWCVRTCAFPIVNVKLHLGAGRSTQTLQYSRHYW